MLKFFRHIKFWGPFLVVALLFLIMELILRTGVWDSQIKPRSYLGHGVYRVKAMEAYGLDKINWVAVGNSVLDWGVNHRKLRAALAVNDVEYARMTMGSSKFPAVQMVADWSVNEMRNLDGLIIGSSASALGAYHLSTQYKVGWPFLSAYDASKYTYNVSDSALTNFYQKLALFVYFNDIKDFFVNYQRRTGKVNENYFEPERIINFNVSKPENVCGYQLATLSDCVKTANQLRGQGKQSRFEREIINRCPVKLNKRQSKSKHLRKQLDSSIIDFYVQNWSTFLLSFAERSKRIKFLILPEHQMLQYTTKPHGMDEVMDRVVANISQSEWIEVHDLRPLFNNNERYKECELFNDGIHLNNIGKGILTDYLIESLN